MASREIVSRVQEAFRLLQLKGLQGPIPSNYRVGQRQQVELAHWLLNESRTVVRSTSDADRGGEPV